ncbi:MAG: T9SS type A sorting domain-containing protein [Bacteroidales bacterium]|nr:T9SS type A sorting domain-containing protein [Bacteroidales bacterium]MCF8398735.1 T9SS type A sorting domain-containing protein [Bacteroidales bacterium]
MKNNLQKLTILLFSFIIVNTGHAEKYIGAPSKSNAQLKEASAGCSPATSYRFLDINNVRARINTGGDMWWDLQDISQYFIPKEGTATSLFASALWIGGLDINDQLKLAALRYRQVGNDYWTGPLTVDGTAAVDAEVCANWDKHFVMTRAMVDKFIAWWESDNRAEEYPDYVIPEEILNWPAHGNEAKNQSFYLAPFYDNNNDGVYDPYSGDYPYYDIDNSLCPLNRLLNPDDPPERTFEEIYEDYPVKVHGSILSDQVIKGDQTLWWIFNDKGNFHSESQGASIGLEIRAQAFAFTTNDEINNMTFYSYEIINRSTFELSETYFSPWMDTDLGYAWDDYVGCDVGRGLGYGYNGTDVDGNGQVEAYGDQPPAVGVDFFQGPYINPDGRDNPAFTGDCSIIGSPNEWDPMAINGVNFGNGLVDDERFGMRRFVYYNNSGSNINGAPDEAIDYYNYLRGIWLDNSRMQYGGNGHPTVGAVGPACNFMFPGDSDPCNWGTNGTPPNGGFNQNGVYWTEETVGNDPSDRRFMQSAGPFTLTSGAVNYITVGIPWARAGSGGAWASVELLRTVDDKCQALFDNCFDVIDGPDAPDLDFVELDEELIVFITNSVNSNNYKEAYMEYDNTIPQPSYLDPNERNDSLYHFEGYQIFQLKNASVSVESIHDPDLVRPVAQFDKANGITRLINYYKDEDLGTLVPVEEVDGGDNGIRHSFRITEDQFATGDRTLVNHKQYYYLALAYAYNEYMPFKIDEADPIFLYGQKKPYLAGRRNIQVYTAIPHKTVNGLEMNSDYGDQPQITRLDGNGNGYLALDFTEETVEEILSKKPVGSLNDEGEPIKIGDPEYPIAYNPVYKIGYGPLDVRVVDPLNVKDADYILKFTDVVYDSIKDSAKILSSKWQVIDQETGDVYDSDTTINLVNEQLIPEIGLSVNIAQIVYPGDTTAIKENYNSLIVSGIEYADVEERWLSGIRDNQEPRSPQNWIRAGSYAVGQAGNPKLNDWDLPGFAWDPNEYFEKIQNGTWAPYCLTMSSTQNVGFESVGPAFSATISVDNRSKDLAKLNYLHSVDIVLTPDKSKWTRSVVLEMGSDEALTEPQPNGKPTERFMVRGGQSVDKDGNPAPLGSGPSSNPEDPNYISEFGMGWFPGYAINVETGERLNIAFGEDSWLVGQNGRDMIFNPTKRNEDLPAILDPNMYNTVNNEVRFGGKHYVYVFGHNTISSSQLGVSYSSPAYDAGKWNFMVLDSLFSYPGTSFERKFIPLIFGQIMYVGMPMGKQGTDWLANEAKLKIRIGRPYKRYVSRLDDTTSAYPTQNNYNPMYKFSTDAVATNFYSAEKAETDLDLINVVPNPYYAYSGSYEENSLDNTVKITNLPNSCTVTIFNVKGTLIRQYKKDSDITYLDWDLKNFAGVTIAGGIYLIHVKSDEGERILKWFGAIRPIDLNVF